MSIIFDFLKSDGGAFKSSEIASKTGVDKKEVDKEIKKLVKEGKIASPKKCYYQAV